MEGFESDKQYTVCVSQQLHWIYFNRLGTELTDGDYGVIANKVSA